MWGREGGAALGPLRCGGGSSGGSPARLELREGRGGPARPGPARPGLATRAAVAEGAAVGGM